MAKDRVIKQLSKGDVRAIEDIKEEMRQLDSAVREERGPMARHKMLQRKEALKKHLRKMGVPGV